MSTVAPKDFDFSNRESEFGFNFRYGNQGDVAFAGYNDRWGTREQFEAVRAIVKSPEFNFSCAGSWMFNPPPLIHRCNKGSVTFIYYDTKEMLHLVVIGSKGETVREVTA